jgi:carbon-monoxide dehydrogenase medium subunit
MWENYYSVTSISEALELLAEYGSKARVIAGGTDILIELERGQRPGVDILIDITRIKGLDEITARGDEVHLGSLVTHNQVVGSQLLTARALPLAQACWEVGAPQIRNRASVAGNLITASPANDTITPLIALDASVTLASVHGERSVRLANFYTGLRTNVMRPDEMLVGITFPLLSENERGVFLKLGLRHAQAISVINTTIILAFEDDSVSKAVITLGSVAPTIIRAPVAEKALIGKSLTSDTIATAARLASATPAPIDDVRSTATYRIEMVKIMVARGLRTLAEIVQTPAWSQSPAMLWGQRQGHVVENLDRLLEHPNNQPIEITVNGKTITVTSGQNKTLLRFLREDLKLTGVKEGCAEGECGACTMFLDGAAVMACMVAAPRAHGAEIVTVEGLAKNGDLHPIQEAFIEHGAVQCGYCTPGFLMSGAKLLEEKENPSEEDILISISGNLCRCTGYYKIVEAFKSASQKTQLAEG